MKDSTNNTSELKKALNASPENSTLRMLVADALVQDGAYKEAEEHFKHLISANGDNAKDAQVKLAECFYKQNRLKEAIVILEALQNSDPSLKNKLLLEQFLIEAGESKEPETGNQQNAIEKPKLLKGEQHLDDDSYKGSDVRSENPFIGWNFEKPSINFSDVGGMREVKEEIDFKIIQPTKKPELYEMYGKKAGGGILMYGPPGCGKTHIAKAVAGEINASFISVELYDILDMYIGNSEKRLHQLFEQVRRNAPAVLFFDEVDAIAASRSDFRKSNSRSLINQFLSELDGISGNNEGVLVLAATNAPWHLDNAFRREGRFGRIIFVPPPDYEARIEILKILTHKKPIEALDFASISKKTNGFSGADLKLVVDMAIEEKIRISIKGGESSSLLSNKDLLSAVKKANPSCKEWFATAKNY